MSSKITKREEKDTFCNQITCVDVQNAKALQWLIGNILSGVVKVADGPYRNGNMITVIHNKVQRKEPRTPPESEL